MKLNVLFTQIYHKRYSQLSNDNDFFTNITLNTSGKIFITMPIKWPISEKI